MSLERNEPSPEEKLKVKFKDSMNDEGRQGSIAPFNRFTIPGYFDAKKEARRQALNRWIRSSHAFDGVIDFDKAVRDPARPDRIRADFDSGDHLHPGDAGYQAMAEAIDLALFK